MTTKKILVVEDNELNREMLVEILSDSYTVLEAGNGHQALELLEQRGDEVSLILLDVMMPIMDGFTFLDHIKQDPRLSLIPVIVTTQNDRESDEVAALAHGATDFVPKPYRPRVILHRVASLIKLRETAAEANQLRYDRLTGIFNREYFYTRAQQLLLENPEQDYMILASNLENFKLFNDHYGTAAGDRLLQRLVQFVREQIPKATLYGRATADRFLALMPLRQYTNARIAAIATEALRFAGAPGNVVMKFGLYKIIDRTVEISQMCDRALLAADSIKGQYNRFLAVYDDTLRGKLLREQAITDAMEEALAQKQFTVYLQPKYSIQGDCMAGAEALVRWNHPQWGFLSPGEFIPLFEKNGFITKLDQYIWDRVGGILASWRDRGLPLIPISVNVSRADIGQSDLAQSLLGILDRYGLPPEWMHLEITESAYTENPGQIISTVTELRKLGFIIEMDDFGSGYSSLNMLNQMPMDVLKLDMEFVRNETAKPVDQGVLRFIVGLARWLNLEVVAEGVETREQLQRLRELGCDYAQGYLLGKPMPVAQLEERLVTDAPGTRAPQAAPEEMPETASLLVVDENPDMRSLVEENLSGYQVFTARDLREAIPIIDSHCRDLAMVLVSMTLPEQGATKVLRAIRQNPLTWHIPVLAIAPNGVDMEREAMSLGADEFSFRPRDSVCLHCLGKRISGLDTISSFRKRERVLKDEACRDFLTELLNRRGLHTALAGLHREDFPLLVCMFDLDDLKHINDSAGHFEGDRALREFAQLLRSHTRSQDILCRYGGDEFTVILRGVTSPEAIVQKAKAICAEFHENTGFTCSCGMVVTDKLEQPIHELLRKADQALYRAKRETRGSCALWEE